MVGHMPLKHVILVRLQVPQLWPLSQFMQSIIAWCISLLTFPGVVMHEWAHKKFCDWTGVPVYQVRYFRMGNPVGYVTHAEPQTFWQTFWISTGPLIINSALAVAVSFLATYFRADKTWYAILIWLALSAGLHSFPSDTDMGHVARAGRRSNIILYYLALPLVWLIYWANRLRFFWFDMLYALLLVSLGLGLWF